MKIAKHYISGLFFAALILLPLLFIIGLHIAQWNANHDAKEKLEKSFLQTIVLRADDLHWEKKGKELRIGKLLFDVKHISYKEGYAVITGLYDDAEMALEKKINDTTAPGNPLSFSLLLLMQSFLAMLLFQFFVWVWQCIRKFKRVIPTLYLSPFLPVISPPPLYYQLR